MLSYKAISSTQLLFFHTSMNLYSTLIRMRTSPFAPHLKVVHMYMFMYSTYYIISINAQKCL